MKITGVRGCPYEDHEGEVLNIEIDLEEGEVLYEGGMISIEMMDDSFLEREIKIINPKRAGDYAAVSNQAKQWKQSGKTLKEAKGPGHFSIVVTNVEYHEVKTDEEISNRAFLEEFGLGKMVCITPFKELHCGDKSIYDYVKEGYTVPNKVITYLKTAKPHMMSLGIYEHPFKKGENLLGPYSYTDDYYWWDRDTWKYVLKYHVMLPQEFIDHVMSDAGTEFLKRYMKEESWSEIIKDWKEKLECGICLIPDDAGDTDLKDF